jgi:dihydrolipoamide dehydrogenase
MAAHTQLAVIGAGTGGYPAAFRAADLGMTVTLIDPEEHPGGVCLYRGCIPSKALLHAAGSVSAAREAAAMGIAFGDPKIDLARLQNWKASVVQRLTTGTGFLADKRGIVRLRGRARFLDARTLDVAPAGGPPQTLTFDHAVIATGSEPVRLPGLPSSPRIIDSTGALELREIPRRLLVVGGGYIGLELGQVYAVLGSAVTVVEMTSSLLPGCDPHLVRVLEKRLRSQFAGMHLDTKVESVSDGADGLRVVFSSASGSRSEDLFDAALISIGRRPVTAGLGLDSAGIRTDKRGFIETDGQRRTSAPAVFAVGDVAGQPMLAHKAVAEGRLAAEAATGRRVFYDVRAVPAVVFTDPEIAWTGLSEGEARTRGHDPAVTTYPWSASGRAVTLGRTDGVTRLLFDRGSGLLLGAGFAGAGAGDLAAEATLAIEMGATAQDLALTVHAHPTLSETILEAAELFSGRATHYLG